MAWRNVSVAARIKRHMLLAWHRNGINIIGARQPVANMLYISARRKRKYGGSNVM